MKKFIFLFLGLNLLFVTGCTQETANVVGLPNPWTDCSTDLSCAAKIAGFSFPLDLKDVKVQASKNMIDVRYPLDKSREVIVRKTTEEFNNGDISGDYNVYPIKDTITLDNGVVFNVRRDEKLIYVAYFGAEAGYYSISCDKGMTKNDIQKIYDLIASAEAPREK